MELAAALDEQRLVDRLVTTHIIGSSGNCIRKHAEISSGDHHSSSQVVTYWANGRCASFGLFGRLALSAARRCARHAR